MHVVGLVGDANFPARKLRPFTSYIATNKPFLVYFRDNNRFLYSCIRGLDITHVKDFAISRKESVESQRATINAFLSYLSEMKGQLLIFEVTQYKNSTIEYIKLRANQCNIPNRVSNEGNIILF
jgi:hypothetical protein